MTKKITGNEKRIQNQKNDIVETLHQYPIIQVACQKCGLSRSTFYRRREDDENFKYDTKMAIYRGKKFINDIAETNLLWLVQAKNPGAIYYWLNNNHEWYWYKKWLKKPTPKPNTKDENLYQKILTKLTK